MPSFRRARKSPRDRGMPRFQAGLIAIVLITVFTYFGFTKANPFSHPYRLNAVFKTANNLKANSPVRIAGVDVGKVKKVEPISDSGGARVQMELKKNALPIHKDAEIKVRPRIFLEGNFFVDINPGSPSAPTVKDDASPIPMNQTAAPVQFGDVLAALQSDTRQDLRTFLTEYSLKGLSGGGAEGFNRSIKYWGSAYRNTAIANDATLGTEPTKDIQRVLKGQARTFAALDRQPEQLKGLITNFNITAGAFAREDVALEASVPALRDVLRVGSPALRSVNDALPSLRAFAVDALPGVKSSGPTLDASIPFIIQARKLVSKRELRGAVHQLRIYLPSLVRLNKRTVGVLKQARTLSACTNNVLVPFANSTVPGREPGNDNQTVIAQLNRGFPGLSGESRLSDGNNQFFHAEAVPNPVGPGSGVRPAPPSDVNRVPDRRPDVPCETQDPPNLNAASGAAASFATKGQKTFKNNASHFNTKSLLKAGKLMKKFERMKQPVIKRAAKRAAQKARQGR
jgi:phospholipid/cholesterol/gamma-HCH transport system substrate-binding protein